MTTFNFFVDKNRFTKLTVNIKIKKRRSNIQKNHIKLN